MFIMSTFFLLSILLSTIIMKISILISKKNKIYLEKMSPFECGFNNISNLRTPFSLRFFMITIIFLIFDIEIALILPMINSFFYSNILTWTMTSMILILMLILGLIYEWNLGSLNWL